MTFKRYRVALISLLLLAAGAAHAGPPKPAPFKLVPEMERPEGVVHQSKIQRKAHAKSVPARQGLDQMTRTVEKLWPRIQSLDLVKLSRYQIEATRDFALPETPGNFVGQVVGWDAESRLWHLELRGPRLPAKYDIVHRYLHVYATYDTTTNKVDDLIVTIRGWILE